MTEYERIVEEQERRQERRTHNLIRSFAVSLSMILLMASCYPSFLPWAFLCGLAALALSIWGLPR